MVEFLGQVSGRQFKRAQEQSEGDPSRVHFPWLRRSPLFVLAIFAATVVGLGVVEIAGELQAVGESGWEGVQPVSPYGNDYLGGDFVVFWAAGRIVAEGDGEHLYERKRVEQEEASILGRPGFYGPFLNPAWFALPYAAIAALPWPWAWAAATGGMLAALGGAVAFLARTFPIVRASLPVFVLALAAFDPMRFAIVHGQNTTLSLLFLTGALYCLQAGRQNEAGVWLGLLLFKPQFVLPLLVLLAWRRCWRVVAVAAGCGLVGVALGVLVAGAGWLSAFQAFVLGPENLAIQRECCALLEASLVGATLAVFHSFGIAAFAGVVAVGIVGLVVWLWRDAEPATARFPVQYGLAVAASVALAPHALVYDLPLLVLPAVAAMDSIARLHRDGAGGGFMAACPAFVVAWFVLLGSTWHRAGDLGFQPTVVLPVSVVILSGLASHCESDCPGATRHLPGWLHWGRVRQ